MKRQERKIYTRCIAVMAVYIIAGVWFYTIPADASDLHEKAVLTDDSLAVDIFTAEPDKTDLRAVFDENSAMPCCDREAFEKWMETYEQETSEESTIEADCESAVLVCEKEMGILTRGTCDEEKTESVETDQQGLLETVPRYYEVDGQLLDPDLQEYLYNRLAENQLEWFMPYAIMIAYQESKFDIYAVNPTNHVDCGLFQFRSYYYPGQNIFDPYEQIDIFCQQMANRSQYDVYEMISRHNVSDFGSYNEVYVGQVLAHEQNLRKVN